jgi:glycosyltransferase involved in cell wall biosynthesis
LSDVVQKLLYLVTEDWFFCSHFLDRAVAASKAGYEVTVVAREGVHGDVIRRAGLNFIPLAFDRRGTNPMHEAAICLQLWRLYRRYRPDIVHHVALKPILYGSLAALFSGRPFIVNAPVGMGFVFTSQRLLARLLKPIVLFGMRHLLNPRGSKVVFENKDDLASAVQSRLVRRECAELIRGAGVDTVRITARPEPEEPVRVILGARMLWDKGVSEFVEAAQIVRRTFPAVHFLLVGAPDAGNPASIPEEQLSLWQQNGWVQWLGHRNDMPELLETCHIACLPSYREGLPKFLLEALAAGRAVVATDVPGCREAVEPGVNGLRVPARDSVALARALMELIADGETRKQFGVNGRARAEREFASARVIDETLALYRSERA